MLADLGGRRRAAELARQVLHRVVDLHHALLHPARDVDRPAVVAEVALELAEHRRHGVGGERRLARGVEAIDRLDQPERRDLHEVVERLVRAPVAARHPSRQRQQALHQLLPRRLITVAVVADEQATILLGPARTAWAVPSLARLVPRPPRMSEASIRVAHSSVRSVSRTPPCRPQAYRPGQR